MTTNKKSDTTQAPDSPVKASNSPAREAPLDLPDYIRQTKPQTRQRVLAAQYWLFTGAFDNQIVCRLVQGWGIRPVEARHDLHLARVETVQDAQTGATTKRIQLEAMAQTLYQNAIQKEAWSAASNALKHLMSINNVGVGGSEAIPQIETKEFIDQSLLELDNTDNKDI